MGSIQLEGIRNHQIADYLSMLAPRLSMKMTIEKYDLNLEAHKPLVEGL
jgi:hypothetical protein